jgi:hydroxymethylglutaryl-CoA lyase
MFEQMGLETGVDLDGLLAVARSLPAILGHDLPSHMLKAGPSTTRHPAPAFVADLQARLAHDPARNG